mgnify:CR=1 FL=1
MGDGTGSRRDSRKRRRLSERRRIFGRIAMGADQRLLSGSLSTDQSWSSSSQPQPASGISNADERQLSWSSRSDSPIGDRSKISMKIQFHITVAPDNELLLFDPSSVAPPSPKGSHRMKSSDSIGEQIHEKLSRQNTASTRRRHQLLALHNQSALDKVATTETCSSQTNSSSNNKGSNQDQGSPMIIHSEDNLTSRSFANQSPLWVEQGAGRETGARSSTITGGISDEATIKFLARHQAIPANRSIRSSNASLFDQNSGADREHIYFKRDGQRFGHEFTLKLAVERTYRCLIKVRPLIPLQAITIQGHQVLFVDCSHGSGGGGGGSSSLSNSSPASAYSAPNSSSGLNRSWQNINHQNSAHLRQATRQTHRLNHAQTSSSIGRTPLGAELATRTKQELLFRQQQSQLMRHFAASHCSSANSHLGSQLIYMFDWSATRFEVNKNKARTQVQTVLKFNNGQILTLPLQVKFYQSERRQHLNWGSQLHFIDYDCNIDNMGQISIDRIQYY